MSMRGISVILGMILLIAITTTIMAAIYFWAMPFSSQNRAPPEISEKRIYVEECTGSAITIRNTFSEPVPNNTVFDIYSLSSGDWTKCIVNVTPTLVQGNITTYTPNCSLAAGSYILRRTKYLDAYFIC